MAEALEGGIEQEKDGPQHEHHAKNRSQFPALSRKRRLRICEPVNDWRARCGADAVVVLDLSDCVVQFAIVREATRTPARDGCDQSDRGIPELFRLVTAHAVTGLSGVQPYPAIGATPSEYST